MCIHSRDVSEVEAFGELEVELNGGALDGSSEGVFDGDVDFGPVKGAVARVQLPLGAWHLIQTLR